LITKLKKMKNIEIISIPVADQQKSKEFYLKLGFQIIMEAPMGNEQTWIQMGLPNQDSSISLANFQGIILETDDMDKEVQELKTKGIETGNIDDTPWGKFCWLKDLDGNKICLHQK
jgi:catechol 2,3-dioxygenase-like lactoylglutathione lyase family enzyme